MNPLLLSAPSIDELSAKSQQSLLRYSSWFSAHSGATLVAEMRDVLANVSCAVGRGGWVNGNPTGWSCDYSYEEFDTDVSLLQKEIQQYLRCTEY